MELRIGEMIYPVTQMGPDFLILEEDLELPPCDGFVVIEVDGSMQWFSVGFPNRIQTVNKRVEVL